MRASVLAPCPSNSRFCSCGRVLANPSSPALTVSPAVLSFAELARLCSVDEDGELLSAEYARGLARVARSLEAFGILDSSLIGPEVFNNWLRSLRQSPTTRSNYRRMGLRLWRHALAIGCDAHRIETIIRVKTKLKIPVAWSSPELSALATAALRMTGRFPRGARKHLRSGPQCHRSKFWLAWVLVGYESGLRQGDLYNLKRSNLRASRLFVVMNKTGVPVGKLLSPDAAAAAHAMLSASPDGTMFSWALCRTQLFRQFLALTASAGLEGTTKFLRRSGATHCEMVSPGPAPGFLGHLSGSALAKKHYLDPTLLAECQPQPPRIFIPLQGGELQTKIG